MKKLLLAIPFFFFFSNISGQDLHVYYDVFRDSIWYMSNGKSLDRPIVRQGYPVYFHLLEYNRYALRSGIQTTQEDIGPGLHSTPFFLLDPLAPGLPNPESELIPSGPGHIAVLNAFEEYPAMPAIPAIGQARGPLSEVVRTLENLHGLDQTIRTGSQEMEELEATFLQMEDMSETLDALLQNPFLPPSLVQEEATRYRESLEGNSTKLDFRQSAGKHRQLLRALKARRDSLAQLMEVIEVQRDQWQQSDQEPIQALVQTMGQTMGVSRKYLELLEESIEGAEAFDEQLQQKDPATWENLRFRLKEIGMTPFSLHSQQLAERDQLTYEVEIQLQEEVANRLGMSEGQTFRKRSVLVSTYGGFKINASVGVSFVHALKPVEDYFVREGLIGSRQASQFFPSLVSFLHFYSLGKHHLSWGGSFGIGLPLWDGSQGQSPAFFLGPSVLLGKRDRLVFTAGLAGASVKRLDEGILPGDRFDAFNGEIPVFSHYELGLFVGLSFNLLQ